jgi:hypothetical protein
MRKAGQGIVASLLRFCPDFYGERSFFGPRYRSRTSIGGFVSVCFIVVISLLFVDTWIEFFGAGYFLSQFGMLHANSLMGIGPDQTITAVRNAILPTLSLYLSVVSYDSSSQNIIATTITQSPTARAAHPEAEDS